ncbi:MAG: phosphotransferase [Candidatus Margulisiibacteriota bacterium]
MSGNVKQLELKGHSGCKVYLMVPEKGRTFVRKISKGAEYNSRLKKQCKRQNGYQSKYASVPQILAEGQSGDLYYFDMEYVLGDLVSSLLKTCSVDKIGGITDFLCGIIQENKELESSDNGAAKIIEAKIKDLYDNMGQLKKEGAVKKAFKILDAHDWSNIKRSPSHGDLTLENVIHNPHNNTYYLIDFLDAFYDTWVSDASKALLDLLVGWSFRSDFIRSDVMSENTKVRVLLLSKQFISKLDGIIKNRRVWEDVYAYLLLDLLRVMPYSKEKEVLKFLSKSLDAIVNSIKRGGLYDHITNSLCWPVFSLSWC